MNISSKAKKRGTSLKRSSNYKAKDVGLAPNLKPTALSQSKSHTKERGFRSKLQFLLEAIKKLDVVFEKVECYGQEIPCIRAVRELARRLKVQLGNEYGAFNRVLGELVRAKIRGVVRVGERVGRLREIVNGMVLNDNNYIEKLEDIRQCLGEMSGLVEIILNVEYAKN